MYSQVRTEVTKAVYSNIWNSNNTEEAKSFNHQRTANVLMLTCLTIALSLCFFA